MIILKLKANALELIEKRIEFLTANLEFRKDEQRKRCHMGIDVTISNLEAEIGAFKLLIEK